MDSPIDNIQQQINAEQKRHTQTMQNLKSRLEQAKNNARFKREQEKRRENLEARYSVDEVLEGLKEILEDEN